MKAYFRMNKLIIIPAYNEAESILNVIDELRSSHPDYDYVVVNDCSDDDTLRVLSDNSIPYLDCSVNLGIGGAVQTGYRYALYNDYDIAIQMDGDGQHDPAYLDALTAPIEAGEADICIGSRFVEKSGFQSSRSRRFGIAFLSGLIRMCTHTRIKDVTSGYRAVDREFIRLYADYYPQDYPEPEAIVIAHRRGARISEIPVKMRERTTGTSSINLGRSVYYMIKVSLAILIEITRRD